MLDFLREPSANDEVCDISSSDGVCIFYIYIYVYIIYMCVYSETRGIYNYSNVSVFAAVNNECLIVMSGLDKCAGNIFQP